MTVTIQPDHRQLGFRVGRRQIRIFSKGLLRSQKRFRRMSLGAKHSRQIQHNLDIRRILVGCRMRSDVFGREMAESEGFEPPIDLRLCLISSQVHSAGLCQLSYVSKLT